MVMSEYEIYRSYKEAKNQKAQLQILADLNDVPRKEISKLILGYEKRTEKSENVDFTQCEEVSSNDNCQSFNEIVDRLETLDALIGKYSKEYKLLAQKLCAL